VFRVGQVGQTEGNHEEDSDQRNIGVTVGQGLLANLHESDDGNQSAEEPEPSHGQITPGAKDDDRGSDGDQDQGRENPLPGR